MVTSSPYSANMANRRGTQLDILSKRSAVTSSRNRRRRTAWLLAHVSSAERGMCATLSPSPISSVATTPISAHDPSRPIRICKRVTIERTGASRAYYLRVQPDARSSAPFDKSCNARIVTCRSCFYCLPFRHLQTSSVRKLLPPTKYFQK